MCENALRDNFKVQNKKEILYEYKMLVSFFRVMKKNEENANSFFF